MLRLQGEVVKFTSKPWKMDDGSQGISHTARVETGRGEYEDVKIPDSAGGFAPADGDQADWAVTIRFGKVVFVSQWSAVERAARPLAAAK